MRPACSRAILGRLFATTKSQRITEVAQRGLGRNQTIKLRDRSVPIRGSVGWVSKCWQLPDPRDSPDATALRYWPVSHCRSAYCPL